MISHATEETNMMAQVKIDVCLNLRISDKKYDELMYESGCSFLELRYTTGYAKQLKSHALFWKWWKVQYAIKDREYLRVTKHHIPKRTQSFYFDMHVGLCFLPGKLITGKIVTIKQTNNGTHAESN